MGQLLPLYITEKDREDLIDWGVKNKVDFLAASFVVGCCRLNQVDP
jgi:pyruvate kinase